MARPFILHATICLVCFGIGLFASTLFDREPEVDYKPVRVTGTASASCRGSSDWRDEGWLEPIGSKGRSTGLQFLAKPRPKYTELAFSKGTSGKVVLRVTFLASGWIGKVEVIKGLTDGLTEAAIRSARNIRFRPASVDGRPQTVTKQVEYTFELE